MKKWIIIAVSFLILLFLGIRGIYLKVHRIEDEKRWYVSQLNLRCTLQVDSIVTYSIRGDGFLICELVSGKVNRNIEHETNRKLKRYKRLRFLNFRKDGRVAIRCLVKNYQVGDSLQIDTSHDQLLFYRNGKSAGEARISNYLVEVLF